jgi:hypothetical protein
MLTCAAIQPANGIIGPRFTFASALLRGDDVQGIVGSFIVRNAPVSWVLMSATFLEAGRTLGELAHCLNDAAGEFPGYICIGDPDLRLEPVSHQQTTSIALPAPIEHIKRAPSAQLSVPGQVVNGSAALQAVLVRSLRAHAATDPIAELAIPLAQQLESRATGAGSTPATDRLLCQFLTHFLADGVFTYKFWLPACRAQDFVLSSQKHSCGEPLLVRFTQPSNFEGGERSVWVCTRCGSVGETPRDTPLVDLRIEAGLAHVNVEHVKKSGRDGWIAGTVESVGFCSETPLLVRPLADQLMTLTVSSAWALRGLRWFAVCIVSGGEFTIVRTPFNGKVNLSTGLVS